MSESEETREQLRQLAAVVTAAEDAAIAGRSVVAFEAARDAPTATTIEQAAKALPHGPAYESWRKVMAVLEPLDPIQRSRVLRAAAALLGVEL